MQPMAFGAYIKRLLLEKEISASELARMMEYKSRNTIFRILDEEGSHASRQAFYDRLLELDNLELSDIQKAELAASLEVSRVGLNVYQDNLAMAHLLRGIRDEKKEQVYVSLRGEQEGAVTLEQKLSEYTQSASLKLTISGCCTKDVSRALREVLIDRPHTCSVSIVHYVYTGAEEIIANMATIQPMLFSACYKAYSIAPGIYSPERERIYRSNCICVSVTMDDGSAYDEAFVFADRHMMVSMGRRSRGGFIMAGSLLDDEQLKEHPIKAEFVPENPSEDLLAYVEECRKMEHNRAVYNVKLDMPISIIHPDMLVRAAMDGFREAGFVPEEEVGQLIEALYAIHLDRFNNYFTKRKPTHMIFSRKAMEAFAQTGRLTDHFFALRRFTVQERRQILTHILEQAQENPNFSVYFFKDDVIPPDMEIGLYEGVGVLLSKAYTCYDLADDHQEAVIGQSDFCQRFKAYFIEDLLSRRVISQEETHEALRALIDAIPVNA